LLRAVGAVAGVRRLRFTSPYPTDFTDAVLAAMAETPAVCEHVHLPVQSGSSRTLKRMLRRYDRARYLQVVAALREAVPGIALSTDIIVGFPGETEADPRRCRWWTRLFDDAYTFYSARETPAVRQPRVRSNQDRAHRQAHRRPARAAKNTSSSERREVLVGDRQSGDLLQTRPARTRSRWWKDARIGRRRRGSPVRLGSRSPRRSAQSRHAVSP
jgi:tRNA-2-methylthio-N6-dimethylallyladenosine synthase